MPKPPPRSSSGSSTPCSRAPAACRPSTRRAATSKPLDVEDLRADVRVQPAQLELGPSASTRRTASRGAALGQREAELLVLVGGGDVLVRVRLDARPSPGAAPAARTPAASATASRAGRSRSSESTTIRPMPASSAALDLGVALVVAVQADPLPGDAGRAAPPPARRRCRCRARAPPRAIQRATSVHRNALPA